MKHLRFICAALTLGLLAACSPPPSPANLPPRAPAALTYTTSFVCEDGNTPVQSAVCSNRQLAALDVQLSAIFRQHMATDSLFQQDQVLAAKRAWLLGLQASCNVTDNPAPADPATAACLANAYQAQIADLTNWPLPEDAPRDSPSGAPNRAIAHYVQYKLLDDKQPALCDALNAQAAGAMSADGSIDPAQLDGAQEISGSHGSASGPDPQGGTIAVDLYRAGLYGGYQIRARLVILSGSSAVLDPTSLGTYVESLPNGGGRFVAFASQTGDYGDIDVFTLNGQLLALVTDTIGYNSPASPGEAATAALYTINQATAAPACLFETYIMPPPISLGTFSEQPSLTPFIALVDAIDSSPSAELAPSDRQDSSYLAQDTRWMLFNMPLVVLEQARAGNWTGWLRSRHDQVLDILFAWSHQSAANQATFKQMFGLLRPAATDLDTIYVQQQGLSATDAEQATALAMMELLYRSTINLAPGLGGGPADPSSYSSYKPRYPILANPQSTVATQNVPSP